MTKHPALLRTLGVLLVSLVLGGLVQQLAHDVRMGLFVFLLSAFAGSMFAMISLVTKET